MIKWYISWYQLHRLVSETMGYKSLLLIDMQSCLLKCIDVQLKEVSPSSHYMLSHNAKLCNETASLSISCKDLSAKTKGYKSLLHLQIKQSMEDTGGYVFMSQGVQNHVKLCNHVMG